MNHEYNISNKSGKLKFTFRIITPQKDTKELPEPQYILIEWIEASPQGQRILKKCAKEMINKIQSRLGYNTKIILHPASGTPLNPRLQKRMVDYYKTCGFQFLPSSKSKYWMTWKHTTPTLNPIKTQI